MSKRKLKRAVVKEELVKLTGDLISAIVLNQFLYWLERKRDFDAFVEEEKARNPEVRIDLSHGWIYKSIEELNSEIMSTVSDATLRRRTEELVSKGWIDKRRNPKYRWDRTWQYRPNVWKIQIDLAKLGYVLDGYPLRLDECIRQFAKWSHQNDESMVQDDESNLRGDGAVPEITTENTTEITHIEVRVTGFSGDEDRLDRLEISKELRDFFGYSS